VRQCHTKSNRDSYRYSYSNTDRYCYFHADCNSNNNTETYSYSEVCSHAERASDSAAETQSLMPRLIGDR
jgi:hypothetical protein